jgi:hypothetical protein
MKTFPTPDESFARLHRAGWSVGETGSASFWLVTGTNGENILESHGRTQAEAWHRAVEQAEAMGMAGRASPTGIDGLTRM